MADLVVVVEDVLASTGAATDTGVAGQDLLSGQAVYLDSATGTIKKAVDTSAAAAAAIGITLHAAYADQPIAYIKAGGITLGCATAVGAVYGVTDTAGGISLISERAAGDYITILGIGSSITEIVLRINASGVAIA